MRFRRCVHPDNRIRVDAKPGQVVYRCEECLRRKIKQWCEEQEKWLVVKDGDESWRKSLDATK